ncbi:MAG: hypothetical protein IJ588_06360 [Prevotella sp.]|nr:hypothetical protein [Prevotella sp.]
MYTSQDHPSGGDEIQRTPLYDHERLRAAVEDEEKPLHGSDEYPARPGSHVLMKSQIAGLIFLK